MNRSIRFVAIFSLLLVLILMVNLTVIHAFRDDEYAANPLNNRAFLEMKTQPRGQITAGGQVLASSWQDDEGIYHRTYENNYPTAYGPVTGYLSDIYGASGLESSYNNILNGTDPSLAASQWLDTLTGKDNEGANIETTLVPAVQQTAYNALAERGYEGAAVALRPSTGEILALASTPGYDPNQIVDPATAEDAWSQLNSDPANPLLNTATQETLPPGSIFKIITTAAGLDNGYDSSSSLTGASSITLPNTNTGLTNYNAQTCGGGGQVTLQTAFALSCNTAFAEMAMDVGDEAMREAATAFGVGEQYDIGLPTSPGSLGEIPDDASLAQTAIGQRDVTMSALQAAVMASVVANDGVRMSPYLVSRVTGTDLQELRSRSPEEMNEAISPEVAAELTDLMRASERNTSGYTGQDIASKTGTAEHGEGVPPHTWYVAFAPSEDADVAVAVVVKDGGGQGSSATGGSVSSPIGREILNSALQNARE